VAYRLQLPDHSPVHPVVHVSQLRRAAGFKGSVSTQLPAIASLFRIPQQVLGSRLITRGANKVAQVRVRWSELPDDLATWEYYVSRGRIQGVAAIGRWSLQAIGQDCR
jgi:hypothetical protein